MYSKIAFRIDPVSGFAPEPYLPKRYVIPFKHSFLTNIKETIFYVLLTPYRVKLTNDRRKELHLHFLLRMHVILLDIFPKKTIICKTILGVLSIKLYGQKIKKTVAYSIPISRMHSQGFYTPRHDSNVLSVLYSYYTINRRSRQSPLPRFLKFS